MSGYSSAGGSKREITEVRDDLHPVDTPCFDNDSQSIILDTPELVQRLIWTLRWTKINRFIVAVHEILIHIFLIFDVELFSTEILHLNGKELLKI